MLAGALEDPLQPGRRLAIHLQPGLAQGETPGRQELQADCQKAPWLQGVFERTGQHRLELRLSLANWRGQVQGTAQPGSDMASVLQNIGWLRPGQSQVMGRF